MRLQVVDPEYVLQRTEDIAREYDEEALEYAAGVDATDTSENAFSEALNSGYLKVLGDDMELANMFGEDEVEFNFEAHNYFDEIRDFVHAEEILGRNGYDTATRIQAEETEDEPQEALDALEARDIKPELVFLGTPNYNVNDFDFRTRYKPESRPVFDVNVFPTKHSTPEEAEKLEAQVDSALREFNIEKH